MSLTRISPTREAILRSSALDSRASAFCTRADHVVDIFLAAAQVRIVHRLEHRDEAIALHLERGARAETADANEIGEARIELAVGEDQAVRVDEIADFAREQAVQFLAERRRAPRARSRLARFSRASSASTSSAATGRSSIR